MNSILFKIQYISLFVASLFIIGLASALRGSSINQNSFKDPAYYIDLALTYTAIILVITATMMQQVDNKKNNSEEYKDAENTIAAFAKEKYVPSRFNKYALVANRSRKKNQMLKNLRFSLHKLEKRMNSKTLHTWSFGTEAEKKKNRLCRKKAILEEELTRLTTCDIHSTDLNIVRYTAKTIEYLDNKNILYDRITANVVFGGYFSKEENEQANDFITKDKAFTVVKDRGPSILLGFAIAALTGSFGLTLIFNDQALVGIVTKIIILLGQGLYTVRYSTKYFETTILKDMRWRRGVVKECEAWLAQQEKNFTQAEKFRHQLQDSGGEPNEPTTNILKPTSSNGDTYALHLSPNTGEQ